ncbi:leucyl/phenylalanyl-tRNA--protein transferase [Naumannella huperziae]
MGVFLHPSSWPDQDLVSFSTGLDESLVVEGYATGAFPMPLGGVGPHDGEPLIAWYSPVRRGILPLDGMRVTRSLRKSAKRYAITTDTAFEQVLDGCADERREGGWIDDDIRRTYRALFRRGLAHSVEAWGPGGRLVGGLYGVGLGGLFAGESMFHDPEHGRDASKAALLALVGILGGDGRPRLLDVQWRTDHLGSLGVIEIPRAEYLQRLAVALELPAPAWP